MDQFLMALQLGRHKIKVADHLLYETYPLVQDPKLFPVILHNLVEGVEAGMTALNSIRGNKPFSQLMEQYHIPQEFLTFVQELKSTLQDRKSSSVEFVRHESYVICDEDYNLRLLTPAELSKNVERAKAFLGMVEVIEHDGILTRRS